MKAISFSAAQVSGDDPSRKKTYHENGHWGFISDHEEYPKNDKGKYLGCGFGQMGPRVPLGCPLGPKFWAQNFFHNTLR